MQVIVKVSGFYGGTWFDEKREPEDMPDAVARAFLPPYGDQLAVPARKAAEKPATSPRADEKKAG